MIKFQKYTIYIINLVTNKTFYTILKNNLIVKILPINLNYYKTAFGKLPNSKKLKLSKIKTMLL